MNVVFSLLIYLFALFFSSTTASLFDILFDEPSEEMFFARGCDWFKLKNLYYQVSDPGFTLSPFQFDRLSQREADKPAEDAQAEPETSLEKVRAYQAEISKGWEDPREPKNQHPRQFTSDEMEIIQQIKLNYRDKAQRMLTKLKTFRKKLVLLKLSQVITKNEAH